MLIGRNAEETEEWNRFWGSGKVEDYLNYKSCHAKEEAGGYAGFFTGDGHRAKSHSRGGI